MVSLATANYAVLLCLETTEASMARTQLELLLILTNGGALNLKAGHRTTQDLVELASSTSPSGPVIILREVGGKSTADLCQIAMTAPGKVIFVVDD
jgi:hypothetical protein